MIQNPDEQPDEEMRRVRSGRVPTQGVCLWGWGASLSQCGWVDPLESPSTPHFGNFMEASLLHFQPLSPLWRTRVWAEHFKLLMMVWSTWWSTPPPGTHLSSVTQSCPTLCNPMNHSTTGLPIHHQLPEFTQTHVHRVGDAIQPSHPLSSPSPPALNPSQHQGLFQWVNSLHEVAKVLEFQL